MPSRQTFASSLQIMRVSSLLLLGLSGLSASSPLGSHVVHEKRHAAPVAWTKHSRAPKDTVLPVRIGLTQRNLEHSDRFLDDISDPDSPNFGENIRRVANFYIDNLFQASTGPLNRLQTHLHRTQMHRRQLLIGSRTQVLTRSALSIQSVSWELYNLIEL